MSGQQETYEHKVDILINKAYRNIFVNKDSSYFYFERLLDLTKSYGNKDHELHYLGYLIYANGHNHDIVGFSKNLNRLENELNLLNPDDSLIDVSHYRNVLISKKIEYQYLLKNYTQAEIYCKQILDRFSQRKLEDLNEEEIEAYRNATNFLGGIYERMGKLKLAEDYYRAHMNLCFKYKEKIPFWEQAYYNTKKLLARTLYKRGEPNNGIALVVEVIDFYEKSGNKLYDNALIQSYLQLCEYYLDQETISSVKYALEKVKSLGTLDETLKIRAEQIVADILVKEDKFALASRAYENVLQETKAFRNTTRHQDVAEIYMKLGDMELERGRSKAALTNYQKALYSSSSNFDSKKISQNALPTKVFSKTQLLSILKRKLSALNQEPNQENTQSTLISLKNTSKNLIATLDALRPEFESKVDKQFLIEQTYPAFHEMIKGAYFGYKKTKEASYLNDAFKYFEKSKGILLLESVKNAEAIAFGTVPDSILDKELQYRAYITNAEKKLIDADEQGRTILNDSLFNLNTDYYNFLRTIEKNYPKYYQLKYDTKTVGLKEFQAFIEADETVLSFHQAQTSLYAMVITKNAVKFLEIPFVETQKQEINQFRRLLSAPSEGWANEAHELSTSIHRHILAPCLKNNENANITIIADGLLNYIPFDALIDSDTGNYVMMNRNIRYANSATLLIAALEKKYDKGKLLAISPSFGSGFSALPFGNQEATLISDIYGGKALINKEATLENFLAVKNRYSLFHFATHALANDEEPDFSYLAFTPTPTTKEENRLYVKDLYNFDLNADMVTLSACESGIGQLQNGEGMLSLSRGFQYAGVPSLTTTLWKNDDQTTSELMGYYYAFLKSGLIKSKALQKAKLEYLENTEEEELKHPYYWAGFVVLGDNSPISEKPVSPWLLVGLGVLGTGILLFGYQKLKAYRATA